jgi:nucleoside 2-deoxyribosyltransferase-like protein
MGAAAEGEAAKKPGRVVLIPPEQRELTGPVVFLAGPIQGTADWQSRAIERLGTLAPSLHVASPRRDRLSEDFDYVEQYDWETMHLRRAAQDGVVMFWLAKETTHHPERAYAQTTRAELFEWKVRHERDGSRLIIGIEEGFSGARYIRHRFAQDCPDVPILDSLERTCRQVAAMTQGAGSVTT